MESRGAERTRTRGARRTIGGGLRGAFLGPIVGLGAGLVLASPAWALPANFDPVFGFDDANLGGLDSVTLTAEDPFLTAAEGSPAMDVELSGSTQVCILFGDSVCRASTAGVTGPYSVIATVSVAAVNSPLLSGPFSLFLTALGDLENYTEAEVAIELDPTVPAGLDTSAVPGFAWNGSFTPLTRVIDETYAPSTIYDYVGWTVSVGDSVTFQYDVLTAPAGRGTPQLLANASPIVPEPGAALLMALGLAGLARSGARRRD